MPITPFHFGPGAAVHALAPRHVSFIAFAVANVLMDIEPLYFMLSGQWPLHRFFHTFVGATLIALMTMLIFVAARNTAARWRIPDPFAWQSLSSDAVVIGATVGAYSHILLDSIMHADIKPFAPLSDINPLLHVISLGALHWFCVIAGVIGSIAIFRRKSG